MSCIQTILGFDSESPQLACIKFRSNPQTYYLTCDINNDLDLGLLCTAYTNSNCNVELSQSGYLANNLGYRHYSKNFNGEYVISPLNSCNTSSLVKKCCGGDEIYRVTNLFEKLGGLPPVGIVIDMLVTDSNMKQFRTCFEVVDSSLSYNYDLFSNVINKFYDIDQCSNCINELTNNGLNCYLSEGDYTFENCNTGIRITLTIPESNVFKLGDVVFFDDKCYFVTLTTPIEPSIGVASTVLDNGCNDEICGKIDTSSQLKSMYVSGCCDNQIYKLQSNTTYDVGTFLSVGPTNFCYEVIPTPELMVPFIFLNDNFTTVITTGCDDIKCQPCVGNYSNINRIILENQTGIQTIYPLKISCKVTNPKVLEPTSGVLDVDISGGTPPYNVEWFSPGGQKYTGKIINNKPAGTYLCQVQDRFGDYKATIDCTLTQPIDCNFDGLLSNASALSCDNGGQIKGYAIGGNQQICDVESFLKYAEAVGII